MRRPLACLLAAALVLLAPAAAHAGTAAKNDPADVDGRLDLKRVVMKTPGKHIVGTIRTHEAFADDDLTGTATIGADFKVGKNKLRSVVIVHRNGQLRGKVCTYTPGGPVNGKACSKVKVTRPHTSAIRFKVARAKIAKGAKTYRWNAGSFASAGAAGCTSSDWCRDTLGRNPGVWFTLTV